MKYCTGNEEQLPITNVYTQTLKYKCCNGHHMTLDVGQNKYNGNCSDCQTDIEKGDICCASCLCDQPHKYCSKCMQKRQVIQLDPQLEEIQSKQKDFFDLKQKYKDVQIGKTVAVGLKLEGTIVDKARSGIFSSGERYFNADLMTQKLINKADLMTQDSDSKNTIIDLSQIVDVKNPRSLMSDSILLMMVDRNETKTQIDLKCCDPREFQLWFAFINLIVSCNE